MNNNNTSVYLLGMKKCTADRGLLVAILQPLMERSLQSKRDLRRFGNAIGYLTTAQSTLTQPQPCQTPLSLTA
jgi:hypothetical protein